MIRLHHALERNTGLLIFGILLVSSIGGLVQVLPSTLDESLSAPSPNVVPYAPLELVGRDIYIRESCSTCHSQQVRPLLAEVKRYGAYARAGEFAYDRPFLWGSKRTGPDLLRVGGKYTDAWHRVHLLDPRAVIPTSIMPAYPYLFIVKDAPEPDEQVVAIPPAYGPLGGKVVVATPDALDLVKYLQGLNHTYPVLPPEPKASTP